RGAGDRGAPAGDVRARAVAAGRRPRAADDPVAVARRPPGAGDARSRELLGARLRRGAARAQGPLSEALLARGPAGRRTDRAGAAEEVRLSRAARGRVS